MFFFEKNAAPARREPKDFCFSAAPTIEAPVLKEWAAIVAQHQE
jgi:hypothetical protein